MDAPQFKRTVLSSAIAMACCGASGIALAAPCPATVSTAIGACDVGGTASLTVTGAGSITGTPAVTVAVGATGTITNSGFIGATKFTAMHYDRDLTGLLDNRGTIIVDGMTSGTHYAVYINNDLSGTLNNSGLIRARQNNTATVTLYGVYIGNDLTGTLTNTGQIEALATTSMTSDAYVYGIYVNNDLSGTLTNEGTVTARAFGSDDTYSAYGIYIGHDLSGTLNNSGDIEATALITYDSSDAFAYGVYIGNDLSGTLDNSGSITARAAILSDTETSATAFGVYIANDLTGTLNNSGDILAKATNGTSTVRAFGVYISHDLVSSQTLSNSGSISAIAAKTTTSDDDASAWGVYIGNDLSGALSNSGEIIATANGIATEGQAVGVFVGNDLSGTLDNSGSVFAQATNSTTSYYRVAYGVRIGNDLSGELTNSGSITADAFNGYNGSNAAIGVYIANDLTGMLDNSGSIKATYDQTRTGTTGTAIGLGIQNNLTGTITNSGEIMAEVANHGSGTMSAIAYGIAFGTGEAPATGTLVNSGTVSAHGVIASPVGSSAPVTVAGVWIGGDFTGTLDNSGTISAELEVSGPGGVLIGQAQALKIIGNGTGTSITNSGTIAASGTVETTGNVSGSAAVTAVSIGGNFTGTFVNSGTISAELAVSTPGGALNTQVFAIMVGGDSTGATFTNSGAIVGDVMLNGGTLNLNSGTIDGAITSVNALDINIGGVHRVSQFDLGGANIDAFHVASGGEWQMNAAMVDVASFAVDNGGRLSFTKTGVTLAENVTSAGTVAVNSGVSATINGNYTQAAGGVFKPNISQLANPGKLTVTGTADLSASPNVDVTVAGLIPVDTRIEDVLSAGTLVTGGTLNTTDNSTLYDAVAVKDGNTIDITFERGLVLGDAVGNAGAELGYAAGAAAAFDALVDAGGGSDLDDVIVALSNLATPGETAQAIAQMVPALTGGATQASQQNASAFGNIVGNRISGGRGLSAGDSTLYQEGHLWIKPFGGYADQNRRSGVPGFDVDTVGIAFGGDIKPNDRLTLGLGFAWSDTEVEGKTVNRNEVDVDTYQLVAYGNYELNATDFVEAYAIVGWNSHDSHRDINFGTFDATAEADYDSIFTRIYAGVGREYRTSDSFSFTPVATLRYTYIDQDGFTETGAGALNLQVRGNDEDSLILGLDGVGTFTFGQNGIYALMLRGGLGYDVLTDRSVATSTFAGGGGAFVTSGQKADEFVYRGGIGLKATPKSLMSVRVDYEFEGRSDYQSHGGSLNFRWQF